MRKIISLVIIAIIVFTFFSCSGGNKSDTQNTSGTINTDQTIANTTEEPGESDDLGEYNFDGYTWKLLSRFTAAINVEEETGDLLDDAVYRRNKKIEDRFNFKISEKLLETGDMTEAKNSLLAGDNAFDVMIIQCNDAFVYAQEGLIHSIKELPYINMEKSYWDKWLTSQWTIANKSFFASSAMDINSYDCTGAMLFNKKLAADLGIDNIYQLVSDGKWTFDKFAELGVAATKDVNGDGIMNENDNYGYLSALRNIPPTFWIAGGVKCIEKDKDDIPYLAANSEKFLSVFFKTVDTILKTNIWYQPPKPDELGDPQRLAMFKNGQSLFMEGGFGDIPDFRDMEIDFGIIPYPKYDENQDRYYTRIAWAELMCFPLYCDEASLERTSVIIEALACESAKSVIPVYYDKALKTKFTRDDESAAIIDLLFQTRVFDLGDTIWTWELRDSLFAQIFQKKSDTVVSRLEKIAPTIQKLIDKTVTAFEAVE